MRTKPILLATLLGLAAVGSASAQVYSVNAVGFVNVTVPTGFSLIANPLNAPVNTLGGVLGSVPNGTLFYKFVDGAYQIFSKNFGSWDNPDVTLAPGEGGFIRNTGQPYTVTFVGEVMQGDETVLTVALPQGFSIKSSMVPQELPLSTSDESPSLKFPAANGDRIYFFRSGAYEIYSYSFGQWDAPPIPKVGESFFVRKSAATTWTRSFSVNN